MTKRHINTTSAGFMALLAQYCLAITLCLSVSVARADTDPQAQMLLGNPDAATTSPNNKQHYLIQRANTPYRITTPSISRTGSRGT